MTSRVLPSGRVAVTRKCCSARGPVRVAVAGSNASFAMAGSDWGVRFASCGLGAFAGGFFAGGALFERGAAPAAAGSASKSASRERGHRAGIEENACITATSSKKGRSTGPGTSASSLSSDAPAAARFTGGCPPPPPPGPPVLGARP